MGEKLSKLVDRVAEWLLPDPAAGVDAELKFLVNGDGGSPDKKNRKRG